MRVSVVALVVVLMGLVAWWMSGPAPRRPTRGSRDVAAAPAGLPIEHAVKPVSGGNLSDLGQGASWSRSVSTFPVRLPESATYTALVGDGPVSESGPGSVTEIYPPSRVTYITTTTAEDVPEAGARVREREPERPQPRGEPVPAAPAGRDRSLDAAIEGGLGTGGARRPDDVPGQIR